jgi:hypothetical protein
MMRRFYFEKEEAKRRDGKTECGRISTIKNTVYLKTGSESQTSKEAERNTKKAYPNRKQVLGRKLFSNAFRLMRK